MPSGVVARRYAQAIFDIAEQSEALEEWERDLRTLADTFGDPLVAAFFQSPKTPNDEKRATAQRLLGPRAQPLALNLVGLLIERGRFAMVPAIYNAYHELLLERQGIAVGEITTAVRLSDEERAAVERRLREIVGKEVELRTIVDPDIIGGIIARVGDQLIDGSVTSQLRKLRENLITAR